MRLSNQVAIITGAGRGIGRATALRFSAEGAIVVCCDIGAGAQETAGLVREAGGSAESLTLDVTDTASVQAMVDTVVKKFGRIDVLVNNAGIVMDAQLKKMSEDQFDRVIDVNLKGVYNCTRAVVDTMIAQNAGVILTTSSIVGLYGNFGQTNYAASKFGVIGMTKTWARELGKHGIRANAVCPGFINTPIIAGVPDKVIHTLAERVPLGRLGEPEEIASVFAFLASKDASYVNGAAIEVCGGMTI